MKYYIHHTTHNGEQLCLIVGDMGNNTHLWIMDKEDNNSPERQAYLAWVAEGNTAEEWEG